MNGERKKECRHCYQNATHHGGSQTTGNYILNTPAFISHVPSEVRQMFIEAPPSSFALAQLFDTHPPIEKRIAVLEQLGGRVPDKLTAPATAPAIDTPASNEPHQHGRWG